MEIQEEAIDVDRRGIKIEKSLRGSEDFAGKATCVQQCLETGQQALVVIDDDYSLLLPHEYVGYASARTDGIDVNSS